MSSTDVSLLLSVAQVDDYQNTNVDGVYAVGDACDKKVGLILFYVRHSVPVTPHATPACSATESAHCLSACQANE